MQLLKTVFHVHTDYSDDSNASVESILDCARRTGVHCVTITDHDSIAGAQALARLAGDDLQVIVGEEVSTREGHVIGLFLHEHIEPGQSARRTAELIHRQGGLVAVPHPFNRIFGCSLRDNVYDMIDLIDIVEICNAQNLSPFPNRRAKAFAERHALPAIVGVDAHHRESLTACYQWLAPFDGPAGFVASLREATLVPGRHSLGYFLQSAHVTILQKTGFAPPAGYGRNCSEIRPKMRGRTTVLSAE